jgi:glycosyltransferase involved in cell wall biosynthesis
VTDEDRAALHERAVELGIEDDLLVTGYVSDELLVRLYQGSELVTFPSLYEGFGLPPFEALRCGAPVICSDSSSLREVQTDPAMRFDPYSIDSMTEALASNLPCTSPDGEVRRQPSPDYSWERAADITVEALCRLEKLTLASDRPRLGLVTPVPPQASGIATYAARMIEHLRHHFDITVFHDPAMGEADPIDGVEIEPVDRLPMIRSGGRGFDHLVYFLGNSTFHVEALEMLKREPGIVLLHDVRLTGLYGEVLRLHPERLVGGSVGSMLAAYYSWRYRPMVEEQQVISPELADRFGIVMTRGVVEDAERVLTHSDYAATLVELDSGERPLVPFAIPVPEREPIDDLSFEPVISTFGIVAPVKCPELLIDALALVSQRVPGATLRFVGGIDDLLLAELTGMTSRLGLSDAVTFTGHVTDAEFEAEQRRAGVAVQLRAFTNGESSAAVTETLAIGLPTVVSDMGAMAELPESAVVHFDHDSGAIGLADELVELLTSAGRRAALRSGALEYAADQTFATAARRLAEVITSPA